MQASNLARIKGAPIFSREISFPPFETSRPANSTSLRLVQILFLDPLSDKILVTTLFLSLTYVDLIPVELTSLVVSRDVLLVYAGLYIRYMGVPPPVSVNTVQ